MNFSACSFSRFKVAITVFVVIHMASHSLLFRGNFISLDGMSLDGSPFLWENVIVIKKHLYTNHFERYFLKY